MFSHVPDGYKRLLKLPRHLWQRFGRVVELIRQDKIRNATAKISKEPITVHSFKAPKAKTLSTIVSPSASSAVNDTADPSTSASQAAPAPLVKKIPIFET